MAIISIIAVGAGGERHIAMDQTRPRQLVGTSEGVWGNAPSWRGRGQYSIRVSKMISPYLCELNRAAEAFTL